MSTTETVLDRHLETFGGQDLDGIMADYADDAVIVSNIGTFRGTDDIAEMFEGLFEEFAQEGTTITVDEKQVEGEYAYITWHAETPDNVYEFATDTFVIRDGEIVFQTLGAVVEPRE